MNDQPPRFQPFERSIGQEIFFAVASTVGIVVFIMSAVPTLFQNISTQVPERLEQLLAMSLRQFLAELSTGSIFAFVLLAACIWLPPIAGAVLLFKTWITRSRGLPSSEALTVGWNLWDVFKVWASSFCFVLIAAFIIEGVSALVGIDSEGFEIALTGASHAAVLLVLCLYVVGDRGGDEFVGARMSFGRLPRNLLYGLKGFLLTAPFAVAASKISELLVKTAGREKGFDTISVYMLEAPASHLPIMVVIAAIAIPFAEEMLFRGLFYPALERRTGRIIAIILSALVFASLHINPYDFLPLFVIGIGLGYTYAQTRSIGACFAFHAANNGLSAAAVLLVRVALR